MIHSDIIFEDKWNCVREFLLVRQLRGCWVSFLNCAHQTLIQPSNSRCLTAKYTVNPSSSVLFRLLPRKPLGMHFSLQPWQYLGSSCLAESCPLLVPSLFKKCCPQHKLSASAKRTLLSYLICRYINWLSEWRDIPRGSQSLGGAIRLLNIILCPCQWTGNLLVSSSVLCVTAYLHFSPSCAEAVHALSFRFDLVSSGEQRIL